MRRGDAVPPMTPGGRGGVRGGGGPGVMGGRGGVEQGHAMARVVGTLLSPLTGGPGRGGLEEPWVGEGVEEGSWEGWDGAGEGEGGGEH